MDNAYPKCQHFFFILALLALYHRRSNLLHARIYARHFLSLFRVHIVFVPWLPSHVDGEVPAY